MTQNHQDELTLLKKYILNNPLIDNLEFKIKLFNSKTFSEFNKILKKYSDSLKIVEDDIIYLRGYPNEWLS